MVAWDPVDRCSGTREQLERARVGRRLDDDVVAGAHEGRSDQLDRALRARRDQDLIGARRDPAGAEPVGEPMAQVGQSEWRVAVDRRAGAQRVRGRDDQLGDDLVVHRCGERQVDRDRRPTDLPGEALVAQVRSDGRAARARRRSCRCPAGGRRGRDRRARRTPRRPSRDSRGASRPARARWAGVSRGRAVPARSRRRPPRPDACSGGRAVGPSTEDGVEMLIGVKLDR